ncbi:hypothetical protein AQ879_07290 [Burkholderia pseudomallei]|nr:hypothetical protein AQ807_04515 [Burkholderia pseudomallei]ONA26720.1 hypothetical protein AQ879_07290 [Burkholderia pseudomallei]ONA29712.1 hypothetical protein AQ880_15990 [Burkholderia pseudomallei]ONA37846.1 hypothetical protein AQ881_20400 [Burkholderia pseudomallei]ONB18037.1 hypothetical protein AQ896_16060 [Burkholderia pseudomallei]
MSSGGRGGRLASVRAEPDRAHARRTPIARSFATSGAESAHGGSPRSTSPTSFHRVKAFRDDGHVVAMCGGRQ